MNLWSWQIFQASAWREFGLENEFYNFGNDNAYPGPHGGTHDLSISLVCVEENTSQGVWAEVKKCFGHFDAEEQFEGFEMRRVNDLIAV